jgi:serine-type D-Ala-D-Ala carboxypeptidase/endopeptidase (penicillin-binding protein 4)
MNYAKSSVGFRSRSRRSRARKKRAFAIASLLALALIALFVKLHSASETLPPDIVSCGRLARFSGGQALKNTSCVVEKARYPSAERSFAPAPVRPWSNGDRNRLREDLQGAFGPAIAGAQQWSFAVVDAVGRTIYDDRAQRAVAPASVQKLIVAASALDALGAQYRYHTLFAARGGIGDDGVLDSDLWLIGSGDPSLQSADLRNGIAMLARSGLRRIGGGVVVDDSALNGPGLNPHWDPDDDGQDYAAPTSAISVDGDTIESHEAVDGVDEAVWTPMQDVARYVSGLVGEMLAGRGIATSLRPAVGAAPLESVVLWDHRSDPLQVLETHMLFVSDNHYAEQLLRTLGEEVTGTRDDAGGIDAERRFLSRRGIPTPGLRLFDGSGLSDDNRVAAITLARLLADTEPTLYLLLPRGGREGTLADYDFTTALGRVRAKSGHLSGVSALAGYVTTPHHGRVAFAFLIDGSPGDPDAAIVRAVDRLALF